MPTKIIVLADDPTGSQTVHSCWLLSRWDVATLERALADTSPLLFILSNTRALPEREAACVIREICANFKVALQGFSDPTLFVSRSDSTLRGHYPLETDLLAEALGPFDAHFLIPAFFEGGRFTVDSVHYLKIGDEPVPVDRTEFSRDAVFGYRHAYLPAYVEEKTRGRIPAGRVQRFTLAEVRRGCLSRLLALSANACCVVDAETQSDLDAFAAELQQAVQYGKRFLFRSAASLLTAFARLPPQPVPPEVMARYVRGSRPGVVLVGSHVSRTTQQLSALLAEPGVVPVEVDVHRLPQERPTVLTEALEAAARAHGVGRTPVIFTSREERRLAHPEERLRFGQTVSALLMEVVRGLPPDIGFLISKGGITSNDVLSAGLGVSASRLVGQILPGVSVTLIPADHPVFPGLPVVIFPGNVGDAAALVSVYRRLSQAA
jgi:uncharacterized protein YgbK (DUF1537 family)